MPATPQRPRDAQPFQLGRASGQAEEASPVLNDVQSFLLEVLDDLAREGAIICEPAIGGLCRKREKQNGTRFADSIRASSPYRLHQQAGQKTAPDQHAESSNRACNAGAIHRGHAGQRG